MPSNSYSVPHNPFVIQDKNWNVVATEITGFLGTSSDPISINKSYLVRLLMHIHDSDDPTLHLSCATIEGFPNPVLLVMNGMNKYIVAPEIPDNETIGTDTDSE